MTRVLAPGTLPPTPALSRSQGAATFSHTEMYRSAPDEPHDLSTLPVEVHVLETNETTVGKAQGRAPRISATVTRKHAGSRLERKQLFDDVALHFPEATAHAGLLSK